MPVLDRVDRRREAAELGCLVLVHAHALGAGDGEMIRHFERGAGPARGVAAVLDVMREGLLPAVEVDRGDALAGLEQRDRDMHRGCGFARAARLGAGRASMWRT